MERKKQNQKFVDLLCIAKGEGRKRRFLGVWCVLSCLEVMSISTVGRMRNPGREGIGSFWNVTCPQNHYMRISNGHLSTWIYNSGDRYWWKYIVWHLYFIIWNMLLESQEWCNSLKNTNGLAFVKGRRDKKSVIEDKWKENFKKKEVVRFDINMTKVR